MTIHALDRNAFLAALAASEFALLRNHLMPLQLRVSEGLHYAGDAIDDVIFPHSGLVAMSVPLPGDAGAGVILVGRDNIVGGFAAAAAVPAGCNAEVLIAGEASRMSASAFRYILDHSPVIRRLAARFDAALLAQAQQTALCNAAHPVEARICRWLLDIQDRCSSNKVPLTQAALAQMLAVRRTTVTLIAGQLETAGAIACHRGAMQITRREVLEEHSCECYAHLKGYQQRLFAPASHALSTGDGAAAHQRPEAQAL